MFCSVLSSTSCKEAFTRFTRFLLLQASFLELPCRFVEYAIPAVSGNGYLSLWFRSLGPYGFFGLWSAIQLSVRKRDESRVPLDQWVLKDLFLTLVLIISFSQILSSNLYLKAAATATIWSSQAFDSYPEGCAYFSMFILKSCLCSLAILTTWLALVATISFY